MFALMLIAMLFTGLQPLADTNSIEIYPVPTPPKVLIYVEKTEQCPTYEDKIISQLPAAIQLHREAVLRFVTELGERYDSLLDVRFEVTTEKGSAHVIFRVVDLESPTAGQTYLSSRLPLLVEIDCDMGKKSEISIQAVILHELYHTLGVGHVREPVYGELMGGMLSESVSTYPSTLDLYAVYMRYIEGPFVRESLIGLPYFIPYVESRPFTETVQKLEVQVSNLSKENYELKYELRNDIKRIDDELYRQSKAIGDLNTKISDVEKDMDTKISSVEQNVSGLEQKVNSLENDFTQRLNVQSAVIGNMQNDLSTLQAEQSELRATINQLSELSGELKRQLDVLQLSNVLLTILVIAFAVAFILSLRRGASK
ncbi:MAG: hypothetical protein QXP38_00040 [Nitrososphaerota archaeon]